MANAAARPNPCSGQDLHRVLLECGAENQYLRKLGIDGQVREAVEDFIASGEWVDLLQVWDMQLITGGPSGLKVVARLIGVEWEVDDAGGGESIVRYDVAVSDDPRAARARQWLLTYNRGDVLATRAIRTWMTTSQLPGIETLDPAS